MKKNVLALLLVAFMLIGLLVIGVPDAHAEETAIHENHCVCGGSAVGVHDHKCETLEWTALTDLKVDFATLESGNYFLTGDVKPAEINVIGKDKDIKICLNGYSITSGWRVFGATQIGTSLSICDCSGEQDANGNWTWKGTVTGTHGSYGGVIYTNAQSTVNIYGGNYTSSSKTAKVGAVFAIAADNYVDVNGDGKTDDADKKDIRSASTLNIYNGNVYYTGTVTNTWGAGAVIGCIDSGNINISGGKISGCTANGVNGTAVGNETAGIISITGGTVTGGTANLNGTKGGNGGAVYAKNLEMTGGTVIGGTAQNGGAIYVTGKTTLNGGTITGGNAAVKGGSVYNDGTLTVNGVTITGGHAANEGGCLYTSKAFTIEKATISNGTAKNGGNISLNGASAHLTLNGGTISGGEATANGGNIYCWLANINMNGGEISNGSAADGGNIYLNAAFVASDNAAVKDETTGITTVTQYVSAHNASELYMTGGKITGGTATGNGGSIYAKIPSGTLKTTVTDSAGKVTTTSESKSIPADSKIHITNGEISGGSAKIYGGNIYSQGELKLQDSKISNGTAKIYGGNIYSQGELKLQDSKISNGTASNADKKDSRGGNVYLDGGSATITGGSISGGAASHGGNISLGNKAVLTANGCAFSDGKANLDCNGSGNGNGGDIYQPWGCVITLEDCTFANSQAIRGGCLMLAYTATVTDCEFNNGISSSVGGNIFVYDNGNLTMQGGKIAGGTTNGDGGNIYVSDGGFAALTNVALEAGTANTTEGYGGSICVDGVKDSRQAALTLNTCSVTGGNAYYGGAVAVKKSASMTVVDSTLETATGTTGRVAYVVAGGTLTIKDSTLNNTTTVSAKNGTCIWNCGSLILQGTVKLSDAADEDVTYQTMDLMVDARNGAAATIDVTELTGQDAPYGIRRWEIDGTDDDCGLLATGANETHKEMFSAWRAGYDISYADGCLYLAPNAVQIMNGTNVVNGYATLDEALTDSAEATHYVLYASMDGQTISKDILLDLNGNDLTKVTVNEGVTVQLYDTANNGFDASACGSLSGTVNGTMQVMTRSQDGDFAYVVICEDGVYSAHRFYRALHAISLNPAADALGYKATFRCDDVLSNYVVDYGFQLWVGDADAKNYGKTDFVSGNLTLRLKNILAAGGGEMAISGRAYIVFEVDGVKYNSEGSTTTTTMKDTVETINTAYATDNTVYSAAQMSAVQALVTKYADATSGWAVADILAWTAPVVDESTDA